jgi:hypothetical protein
MKDLLEILGAMAGKRREVPNPMELFLDIVDRVVKAACAEFSAKGDEVAILLLTDDGKHLSFAAPRKLVGLGTIPITKRDSIAVNVFNKGVGEATNNVPMVKHVTFFESVRLRDRPAPIQKMVTVPIVHEGRTIGIGQVSRKGETPLDAGPDFSAADVRKVQSFFQAVGPYLAEARPDKF